MVDPERRELVCLHLAAHDDARERTPAPQAVSAVGIGDALELGGVGTERVGLLEDLTTLEAEGLVRTDERAIRGRAQPRTVYFLTDAGREHARNLRERFVEGSVVVTNGVTEEVPLAEIDRYFGEERAALVTALARLTEDDRVPLEHYVTEEFVDREDGLDAVSGAVESAFDREPETVLVDGPAGIGKTALVDEALDAVEYDPEPVRARGVCREGADTPYGPLREAFERLPDGDALLDSLAEAREAYTPDDPGDVDTLRTALFRDVADGVRTVASERPLVVFLDNLQWADAATLALFEHLATGIDEWIYPVAFVGAYRTAAVATGDHPLAGVRERIEAEASVTGVTLDPLERAHTRALLEGVFGTRDLPEEFVGAVYESTGGAPVFVRETAQHLLENDAVEPARDEYPTSPERVSLPEPVTDGVGQRLEVLDEQSRQLVELAAVVGETVPRWLLAGASDVPDADRREYVDVLVRCRVLDRPAAVSSTGQADELRFRSSAVREAVLERAPEERTQRHHRRVAETMVEGDDRGTEPSRIAHHFEKAGEADRAFEFYRRAGDRALETYANEVALANYRRAQSLAETARGPGAAERAAVAADLAEVYEHTGSFERAIETAEEGLAMAPAESRERCRLLGFKAMALVQQGDYDRGEDAARRQRDAASTVGADEFEAKALDSLGEVARERGNLDGAHDYHERSHAIARQAGDTAGATTSIANLGWVAFYRGDYQEATEHFRQGVELARGIDAESIEVDCLGGLGAAYWRRGDLEAARGYFEQSLEKAREMGDRSGEAISLGNLGLMARERNEFDRARDRFEECLETNRALGDRSSEATSLNNLGLVAIDKGDIDGAEQYFERSLAIKRDLGTAARRPVSLRNLGEVHRLRGEFDRARDYYERAEALARDLGRQREQARDRHDRGVLARTQGNLEEAREDQNEALSVARDLDDRELVAACTAELGALDTREGEYDRALDRLDRALEDLRDLESRDYVGRTLVARGRHWLARGDLDRAREDATTAAEVLADVGRPHWTALAHRLLGRIAAESGDETAREHLERALETFESVGASHHALVTCEYLVEYGRENGDDADEWLARARELLDDAPAATVERHREWVESLTGDE